MSKWREIEEELDDIESSFRGWGMFVGSLDDDDLKTFELLVEHGRARRVYEGAAGFMGLAKVTRVPAGYVGMSG